MEFMRIPTISGILVAQLFCASIALAQEPVCKARPDLIGPCETVRGALQLYNGTPSARIRIAGAKRTLGVTSYETTGNETFSAPKEIRDAASFDAPLTGVFLVCPLSKRSRGSMQIVCIEGGKLTPIRK